MERGGWDAGILKIWYNMKNKIKATKKKQGHNISRYIRIDVNVCLSTEIENNVKHYESINLHRD